MAFIRPSLVLQAMLVPEENTVDTAKEIKRSYMHIAQSIVREQPPEEVEEGNVMQFRIRMMKPYWDTSDPAACELWDAVMPHWLKNQTKNVSTAMHNFNTMRHTPGAQNVTYTWADFEFNDNALLRVRMDDDNTVGADIPSIAELVRRLMGAKAFGEGEIARVRIPSRESIAAQEAAYAELKAEVEAARAAAEAARAAAEAEAAAAEAAEATEATEATLPARAVVEDVPASVAEDAAVARAAEAFRYSHADLFAEVAAAEGDIDEDAVSTAEVMIDEAAAETAALEPELETASEEPVVPVLPPFKLDFSIWGIEYADGTVAEFDSRTA